jgi:DNA invertase Pin-like site-specific DNA recombinase
MQKLEKRAAIYACIPTAPQGSELDLFLVQMDACKQFCAEQKYTLAPSHTYQEVFQEATDQNDAQLTALLAAAKRGEFDVVVVFAYNRLASEQTQAAILVATLENYGLQVQSVNEPGGNVQLAAMLQQLASQIHAAVDQIEREQRARRRRSHSKQRSSQ